MLDELPSTGGNYYVGVKGWSWFTHEWSAPERLDVAFRQHWPPRYTSPPTHVDHVISEGFGSFSRVNSEGTDVFKVALEDNKVQYSQVFPFIDIDDDDDVTTVPLTVEEGGLASIFSNWKRT